MISYIFSSYVIDYQLYFLSCELFRFVIVRLTKATSMSIAHCPGFPQSIARAHHWYAIDQDHD